MAVRVIDAARDRTRVEAGSSPLPTDAERIAILVHFAIDARLTRSVTTLVDELHRNGYFVVLSSACESEDDLIWPTGMPSETIVLRKPNVGYDFGTAAVAMDAFPGILDAPYVLIVNDSNAGPFAPLDGIIEEFERSPTDAWALTASRQHEYHLQSYFLGFRDGVLASRAVRRFWRDIRHFDDKRNVILSYEVGLSRLLVDEGYTLSAKYEPTRFADGESRNLSVNLWSELITDGYPFVKRELIMKPWVEESALRVPAVVRRRFGAEVEEWV